MHLTQTLIALDQLLNALVAGGWADETLSARAWRERNTSPRWSRARRWIDRLFFWQPAHCRTSYESEQQRRHLPPEYRQITPPSNTSAAP
jgi:hypothetical protein